ncbi:hypothetical protein AOLI_G00129410 [Acnodon oligacanthus]
MLSTKIRRIWLEICAFRAMLNCSVADVSARNRLKQDGKGKHKTIFSISYHGRLGEHCEEEGEESLSHFCLELITSQTQSGRGKREAKLEKAVIWK